MVKVGSPIDSSSAICSDASRDASRDTARRSVSSVASPVMAMASEELVPGRAAQLPQLREAAPAFLTARARQPVAHSMVRGAMRIDSWSG